VISAKIHNSHVLLRRNQKHTPQLLTLAKRARKAEDLEKLLGLEGSAARLYYGQFADLVDPFEFTGRHFRPPDGPVNAMLSFGYTLIYNRLAAALGEKGFNSRLGFFHKGRGSHCALASDLMEPLRHIADRIVLALIHRGELGPQDFTTIKKGAKELCRLDGRGFRTFIRRYEATMAARFTTHDGEKMSANSYLDEIADSLRRSLVLGIPYRALRIN
jgi:CRISPR-associated protein Cas1